MYSITLMSHLCQQLYEKKKIIIMNICNISIDWRIRKKENKPSYILRHKCTSERQVQIKK